MAASFTSRGLVAGRLGLGAMFMFAWAVLKWPIVYVLMLFAVAVILLRGARCPAGLAVGDPGALPSSWEERPMRR
jgi:hypothetical protein